MPGETAGAEGATPLAAGPYLKRVGRGNVGARSLTREEMQRLFGAMLDGEIADLELGGLLIAFRMKGESLDEIAGALAALAGADRAGADRSAAAGRLDPVVQRGPQYREPDAAAAGLLADAGVQVIIHGVRRDPNRITTCEVIQAMGHSPAASVSDAGLSLERGNPGFRADRRPEPRLRRSAAVARAAGRAPCRPHAGQADRADRCRAAMASTIACG